MEMERLGFSGAGALFPWVFFFAETRVALL